MDSRLLATIIAVAKKEASLNKVDITNLVSEVEAKLKEFNSRAPILETPDFYLQNGQLFCKWRSGLTLSFGSVVGPKGDKGDKGNTGPQGPAGTDGVRGKDGLNGSNGRDGSDGKSGKDGASGKDGKDGLAGQSGPAGSTGPKGEQGLSGKDGKQGLTGRTGKDGLDGLDGEKSVGVEKAWVDENHHLKIRLTSGEVQDTGYVRGPTGISSKAGRVTGGYSSGGVSQPQTIKLINPSFTYSGGLLTLVSYEGGHTKSLTYNGVGALIISVTTVNGTATTKTFTYNLDGTLASVTNS